MAIIYAASTSQSDYKNSSLARLDYLCGGIDQSDLPLTFSCTHVGIDVFQESHLYLIDTLVAIYLSQFLLLAIVFEHLDGLIKVDNQASSHCFPCIVRALVELTTIQITNTSNLRGAKFDMVDMLIRLAEDPA